MKLDVRKWWKAVTEMPRIDCKGWSALDPVANRPTDFPAAAWPLWFVGSTFVFTRRFGLLHIGGLIMDTAFRRTILQT